MENPNVPTHVLDAADLSSGMLRRFYVAGGGSPRDFRTDLSDAIAVALEVFQHGLVPKLPLE